MTFNERPASMSNWRRAKRAARQPTGLSIFKRSSTTSDLEQGPRGDNGRDLTQVNTAPPRTPIAEEGSKDDGAARALDQNRSTLDSQGSTVDSPSTANGLRNRKTGFGEDAEKQPPPQAPEKKKTGMFRNPPPKEPYTFGNQFRRTLLSSPINILLLAIPAGFAVNYAGIDGRAVFAINFIAIIPLAKLLSDATEEIALRTGEVLGGLINATFGFVHPRSFVSCAD
jgi:Ca2+:H+ antiporter